MKSFHTVQTLTSRLASTSHLIYEPPSGPPAQIASDGTPAGALSVPSSPESATSAENADPNEVLWRAEKKQGPWNRTARRTSLKVALQALEREKPGNMTLRIALTS